jgi:hypothetical protein
MGTVPASGDLVVVRLLSTSAGEPTMNDISLQINNPTADWPSQVQDVISKIDLAVGPASPGPITAQKSTAFHVYGAQVVDVRPGTSPLGQQLLDYTGDDATDAMPPNDALCVTLRTDVKGRTGRGRMYLCGWTEVVANGGYWEADAQAAADAMAASLLSNFGPTAGGPYTWGVISRFEFKVKRDIPAFTPINSYTVHNEVRSLRRRAIGVRISRHRHV